MRDDHSEVATSTDDYLWLKLGLVKFEENEAGSCEGLTLTQLQTMLLEDFGLLSVPSLCVYSPIIYCTDHRLNRRKGGSTFVIVAF